MIRLIWAALTRLVDDVGAGLIFGCASLAGADAARHGPALAALAACATTDRAPLFSGMGEHTRAVSTDDALARLQKAGVKPIAEGPAILPKNLNRDLSLTIVRDPDGNLVELVGPKPTK